MPLMGRDPQLAKHLKEIAAKHIPEKPKAIVILSAHWESDVVKVTSSPNPGMLFDYGGFPKEAYEYRYPAPGSPDLASKISTLLTNTGVENEFDDQRGFDHGVFVPLLLMYPKVSDDGMDGMNGAVGTS